MNIGADRQILLGDWNSIVDENVDKPRGQRQASNLVSYDMETIINDYYS